jgi:hypothetical protein
VAQKADEPIQIEEARKTTKWDKTEKPPQERIDEGDLAFNRKVCQDRREAEANLGKAIAAMQSWWDYLEGKYALAEADVVDTDGFVTRAAATEEG